MDDALEEFLTRAVAPAVVGLAMILVGVYVLPPRDPAGGWGPVIWGFLIVVGMSLVVVPVFCYGVPRLLPPED